MESTNTADRWAAVLATAHDLIRKRGAEGWSLADLAERADVPLEDLQAEFDSEWDVFRQVICRDEERARPVNPSLTPTGVEFEASTT